MPISVLIVDDHAGFRESARNELERTGFEVVGELGGVARALALASRLRPDVVLVDIRLPDGDGVALAAAIAHDVPAATVVLISSLAPDDAIERVTAQQPSVPFLPKTELSGASLRALLP